MLVAPSLVEVEVVVYSLLCEVELDFCIASVEVVLVERGVRYS